MKHKLEKLFKSKQIDNISCYSKQLPNNCAFFAIQGNKYDGNKYIYDALDNGAKIIFTNDITLANDQNIYYLANTRLGYALAAGIIYPHYPPYITAVTGTNGKSSVVSYVQQILTLLGKNSASIGTLGIESSGKLNINQDCNGLTTADALFLREALNSLYQNQVKYVALEASSHGLDQYRMGDLKFANVAFTSFSQDHLDYHRDMNDYLDAKMKLFYNHLLQDGEVVINSDITQYNEIINNLEQRNIKYSSVGKSGDVQIISILESIRGQKITYAWNQREYNFATNIIGSFQVYNILIAAKLVSNIGIAISDINLVLPKLCPVKGRLQRITESLSPYHIFVDYAHSPDALEKSLLELKKLLQHNGKLIVIFGCGGDRDRTKRPIMGQVAGKIADIIVLTDDNPRTEDPEQILKEIIIGIPTAKIIRGRKEAILNVIESLKKDDILLIAGKGHEDYQIIGIKKVPFSDIEIAKQIINYAQKNLDH